ncbi:phage tail sheath family protein [Actinoplanes sp. CA-051413]|uniref:phage tail sheath family protein n=1 Tax=Actinoplanes sp. CA-051413 TaxID=3239899 RepID=UPI003D971AE4
MPIAPTFPGVYIDELPSAVRTIAGVPTSIAAFVGWAPRGPDHPVHITSFADYQLSFGGLHPKSPMSYAVLQFYQNGGSEAEIVRLVGGPVPVGEPPVDTDPAASTITLPGATDGDDVALQALSPGVWGDRIQVRVDYDTRDLEPADKDRDLYNLSITDPVVGVERYLNISTDSDDPRSLDKVLGSSRLVTVTGGAEALPAAHAAVDSDDGPKPGQDPFAPGHDTDWYNTGTGGLDGNPVLGGRDYLGGDGDSFELDKSGLYALLKTDIFNILCLPGTQDLSGVLTAALTLCLQERAMLIVDPPSGWTSVADATEAHTLTGDATRNAAIYFPRVMSTDPLQEDRVRAFPPCGVMAGVWARTDVQRGVWKAPAGTDASLGGVTALDIAMNDLENGRLNPLAVNCLRSFPVVGPVAWGARTMRGADRLGDQWKYLPVRRLALFLEESLYRGTQWVVFQPNDEPLWSSIRLNVGAFMNSLFRQGAFQGRTPREAYLVKCDAQNNPQNDIDRGIVNILVGFAPLKPAEFVLIHIQQLAGQIQV